MTGLILLLTLVALLAAIVSAVTGVAGGVVLLSGLLLCVPVTAVVPIHGTVQFCAGASRMIAYRNHIRWTMVRPFIIGVLPGAVVGCYGLRLLHQLNPSWVLVAIASMVLISIARKPSTAQEPTTSQFKKRNLLGLGFACGVIGMFVGSTGPLVSGWLLKHDVMKEAHIGSKSVMQGTAHLVKIPLFAWGLDFDFMPYFWALSAMIAAVILGTFLGKILLGRLSTERFSLILRVLLAVIVIKIYITEIPKLLGF